MATLNRLATRALRDAAPRQTLSASFSHSSIRASAALSAPSAPAIFDIFDAPVRLRGRDGTEAPSRTLYSPSPTRVASRAGPSRSKSIYSDALGLPWSLPPPVTFDGPACPPHMSPSFLKKRRLQRQSSIHALRGVHRASTVSFSAHTPQAEPIYRLFDGPSRISRYPYPPSRHERAFVYVSLALGLSSALGWLVLQGHLDLNKNNVILS